MPTSPAPIAITTSPGLTRAATVSGTSDQEGWNTTWSRGRGTAAAITEPLAPGIARSPAL